MRPSAWTTGWIALALALPGCQTANHGRSHATSVSPGYGSTRTTPRHSAPQRTAYASYGRYAAVPTATARRPVPAQPPVVGNEARGGIRPVCATCPTTDGIPQGYSHGTPGPAYAPAGHAPSAYSHEGSAFGGPSYGCGPQGAIGGCEPCCHGPGCLPRELDMTTLPTYVVEPPDILLIEAVNNLRPANSPLRAGDPLMVQVSRGIPVDERDDPVTAEFKTINGVYVVRADGAVDLGPEYGLVAVSGYDVNGARDAIRRALIDGPLRDPLVSVQLAEPRTRQHVAGEHLVRQDGTVSMGIYGEVHVAGLTLAETRRRIECHLARYILEPEVSVDVLAYNSKVYYVVTDGAGAGEQVFRFPCTGKETVLDAISQINGLPIVACKKDIWIARPAPAGHPQQRLAVEWDEIVRGGVTNTNYQVLPGDRIYVRADKYVVFDTMVAKIISPFERLAGLALLSNGTFRSIQYGHRGNGFGGGGVGVNGGF